MESDSLKPKESVDKDNKKLWGAQDAQEQYGRHELLDFLGIKQRRGENTTDVIIEFLRRYLDIDITRYNISISHRMVIPPDKKKYGRDYIPPIYCKFLNRSLVHLILSRRHLLKRYYNPNKPQNRWKVRQIVVAVSFMMVS